LEFNLKKAFSPLSVILLVTLFIVLFDNVLFVQKVLEVYPLNVTNIGFLLSLGLFLFSFIALLITLISSRFTLKPILIFMLLLSSLLNYFMMTYNVVIDHEMIRNSMQTDMNETKDLLNLKLFAYFFFLGILPSIFVYKVKIAYKTFGREIFLKIKHIVVFIAIILVVVFSFSKFYTSFFREHKPLRYYTNPTYALYSFGKYIQLTFEVNPTFKQIGLDAKIEQGAKKKLVIMVVGEAVRADRFSLNGYEKKTNPLLEQEDIINLSNVYSCGTSTAHSVPCMFAIYDRSDYSYKKGISTENVLDVLTHTNDISVLWRDNNSDSKGVATRVLYEDYRTPKTNTICNEECRDEGMLVGLEEFIKNQDKNNIFIVLHQMGNHGPAYYKRYPQEFERFTPTCKTNQLEKCSVAEINNAYDNTVLYTDYFLKKTIDFLKTQEDEYESALIYMSDHGESLGENGVYLHGMPYLIAPEAQKHIASFIWVGSDTMKKRVGYKNIKSKSDASLSQDNLFHSILGLMQVQTEVYDKSKDIFFKDDK
jgi:lipid A ethanolaminephosphotransferase